MFKHPSRITFRIQPDIFANFHFFRLKPLPSPPLSFNQRPNQKDRTCNLPLSLTVTIDWAAAGERVLPRCIDPSPSHCESSSSSLMIKLWMLMLPDLEVWEPEQYTEPEDALHTRHVRSSFLFTSIMWNWLSSKKKVQQTGRNRDGKTPCLSNPNKVVDLLLLIFVLHKWCITCVADRYSTLEGSKALRQW